MNSVGSKISNISKFEILKGYTIRLKRYRDLKIRVFGKDSIPVIY